MQSSSAPAPRAVVQTLPTYSVSASLEVPISFRSSSNESAEAPSAVVLDAIVTAAKSGNRYPLPYGGELVAALGKFWHRDPTGVAVDGGSHALLNNLLLAYADEHSRVIYPWRSFEAYPISVAATGAVPVPIQNRPDGSHDLEAMLGEIDSTTSVVILCNPNNPTGTAFGQKALVDFLDRTPAATLVILDEAYVQFISPNALPGYDSISLLEQYPNLAILRTFSKYYALAGMRVGYLLAHPSVVSAVKSVQTTFPVSQPAIAAAIAALTEGEGARSRSNAKVARQREEIGRALTDRGYPYVDSQANFIWLPLGTRSAEFAHRCGRAGILVRQFGNDGVRITLGQPGLPEALAAALDS